MTRFRSASIALIACLSVALAGCGSGANAVSNSTTPTTPTTTAPQVTLSSTSLTFSSTTVGNTTAAQSVTVTNSGNATLNISNLSITDTRDYTLTTTCGTTLAAAATCTASIAFHPSSAGTLADNIVLTDNANNVTNAQQSVALTGTGVAAGVPAATLSPNPVTFADTAIGSTNYASFTLTNSGTGTLTVTTVPTGNTVFALSGQTCTSGSTSASIAAGGVCTFTFGFTPTTTGANSLTLTFVDNANGTTGSTQSVTLSGAGVSAATANVTLTPATLAFPSTVVGSTSSAIVATLTNGGTITLTGIAPTITGGTTASAFAISNNGCGTTLTAGNSCTISVTFTPTAAGSYVAYLSVADSAANSPQISTLTGTGTAPALTLSPTSISFPTTTIGTTTSAYTATLTNTGTATANLTSISYTGASTFTSTNSCGTTLTAGSSCTISTTYKPADTTTTTGSVTVTSNNTTNITPSPLTVTFSGQGTTATITYKLYVLPDPGAGNPGTGTMAALYALVNSASKTIDMTMYEMQDTTFLADLVAACNRGVAVRVIFSQNIASSSAAAYSTLNSTTNCAAKDSTSYFTNTHQKSFLVDGVSIALMSLNLQTQYYATTRDYALIYNDPVDYAAIEAVFNADYAVAGSSSAPAITPSTGDDLIWSPTTSYAEMANIINNAKSTLVIENEEFSSAEIISAVSAACQRLGTSNVKITIENTGSYTSGLTTIKSAGCAPHEYTSEASTAFYVHAKSVVADYGLSTQKAYMGSINYSDTSMLKNRELGIYVPDQASITILYNTITSDYTSPSATVF